MRSVYTAAIVAFILMFTVTCGFADSWAVKPLAIQSIYQNGVPHTDKNGNYRLAYDPASSFLPLGIYGAWTGTNYAQTWTFSDLANAGFNFRQLWANAAPTVALADSAASAGMQLMIFQPTDAGITTIRNHSAILAWDLHDEPTGAFWYDDMQGHYQAFLNRKAQIKAMDPIHPVFVLDCGWIIQPATQWFTNWNTAGDVACHDNYPIAATTTASISNSQGIPETVSFSVAINNQTKPVWFCAQSFEWNSTTFPFIFPSVAQERCMIYSSIIHGATGILYFTMDSYVARDGTCVGIAPNPKADYGFGVVATTTQLQKSRQLWYAVKTLNSELSALRPAILSPTSTSPYEVSLNTSLPTVTANPIRTLLKNDPSGGMVLLLSNIDNLPQGVRVRFPNKNFAVRELYGSLGFTKSADYIELNAPGWDSRVFKIFDMQSIGNVKNQLNGNLACSGIVSAVFANYLYVETADRTCGIRVNKTAHGRSVGQVVNVIGAIQTLPSGERCIAADDVSVISGTGNIKPLGITNKALGGSQLGLQQGVSGGTGLNNIGLLVKTTGRVGVKDTLSSPTWYMLSDGSGVSVKVYGTVPTGTPNVTVTGISSCEMDVANALQRVIIATQMQSN